MTLSSCGWLSCSTAASRRRVTGGFKACGGEEEEEGPVGRGNTREEGPAGTSLGKNGSEKREENLEFSEVEISNVTADSGRSRGRKKIIKLINFK